MTQGHGRLASQCSSSSSTRSGRTIGRRVWMRRRRMCLRLRNRLLSCASLSVLNDSGSPTESRSEEHTSELQSLMRISYAVFCLKKKQKTYECIENKKYRQHTKHNTT